MSSSRDVLDTAAADERPRGDAPVGGSAAGVGPGAPAAREDDGRGMTPGGRPILPMWLRSGVLAMLLAAFLFALFGDTDVSLDESTRGEAVASRDIRFEDEPDGTVTVRDAADGRSLARLAVGEDGFIRSVMRGLVRERRARGLGAETPFRVTTWTSGFVSLEDPATGRQIELTAFGPDNVAAFARLVDGRG